MDSLEGTTGNCELTVLKFLHSPTEIINLMYPYGCAIVPLKAYKLDPL